MTGSQYDSWPDRLTPSSRARRITACCSACAMKARRRIRFKPSRASREALKEILDLMGLTMDDARRILPELFQPPDPT